MLKDYIDSLIQNNNTNMDHIYMAEGVVIGLVIFTLYLELNPKLGNIWYRQDSMGIKRISPKALLEYFKKPFQSIMLWNPKNWDLNPYMFSTLTGVGFTAFRKYVDHSNLN